MWVSSTTPLNLSFIGPLTTEIYYQTGINGNTKTSIYIHNDSFNGFAAKGSNRVEFNRIER